MEAEPSYPAQSEEHELENDEQFELEVQPIEIGEPLVSTREETEQHEEDQQPTSPDEASEIEAILTPEPPEGSTEGEAREQSAECEVESPGNEHETPDREQEVTSSAHYPGTPHAEQGHETLMDVDTEGRGVSLDGETSLPGPFNPPIFRF